MNKLFKHVFKFWLHGTDWRNEEKINRALARAGKSNPDAMRIYEFWQRRPIRLFSLLTRPLLMSQNYFSFLDSEIQRLPIALAWNRYNNDQLENLRRLALKCGEKQIIELVKNYHLPTRTLVVPLVVHSRNMALPKLIFSEFIYLNDLKKLKQGNSYFRFFYSILGYFAGRYPVKSIPDMALLPFFCDGLQVRGDSYQLALAVAFWLHLHDFNYFGMIGCSGSIDVNTGRIGSVSDLDLKVEASIEAGCELFFTSLENQLRERFDSQKILGFSDLESLFHWLLLNSGFSAVKARIQSWLTGTFGLPDEEIFAMYFSKRTEEKVSWLEDWRRLTLNQSSEQRLEKLGLLIGKSLVSDEDAQGKENSLVPDFVKIAALPLAIADKITCHPLLAEKDYLRFRNKFLCAHAEIHLASRIARNIYSSEFFNSPEFLMIRQRFPLLIWLFFREPVELLQFFSEFEILLNNENALLELVVSELELHAHEYSSVSAVHKLDAEIMHRAMNLVLPGADFLSAENRLPMKKRLVLLVQAQQNYSRVGRKKMVFAKAAAICQKLIGCHFHRLLQIPGISADDLHNPILKPLGRLGKSRRSNSSTVISKVLNRLNLKQPGLEIAKALFENNPDFNLVSTLNFFSRRIYLEPAGEFMTYCLAHWYGTLLPEKRLDLTRRFGLSLLAGAIQTGDPLVKQKGLALLTSGVEKLRAGPEMLLLAFLPEDCLHALRSFFQTMILNKFGKDEERRQKTFSVMQFIAAVLYENHGFSEYKEIWKVWCDNMAKFDKSPLLVRRTIQALMPVYYLITGHEEPGRNGLNAQFNCLNRPQFLFEYIRCFILKGSVFDSSGWNMKFEQEIFSSMVLYQLSRESIFEMQQYLFREVQDLQNAKLALDLQKASFWPSST
jgi:hypothetical protein